MPRYCPEEYGPNLSELLSAVEIEDDVQVFGDDSTHMWQWRESGGQVLNRDKSNTKLSISTKQELNSFLGTTNT